MSAGLQLIDSSFSKPLPKLPDTADTSFMRAHIKQLERKLNDSLNMLQQSNQKEIELMVENRRLKQADINLDL